MSGPKLAPRAPNTVLTAYQREELESWDRRLRLIESVPALARRIGVSTRYVYLWRYRMTRRLARISKAEAMAEIADGVDLGMQAALDAGRMPDVPDVPDGAEPTSAEPGIAEPDEL